ncbi:MAG: xanthine dehydrogenase small subunit [Alphaproteobacteria bacterium]
MTNKIRFLLNGELTEISNLPPTTTVLEYLRKNQNLNGTKEGCAEGDCGACTVVLAEPVNGKIEYKAVNSCIIFVPKLDGKMLITVEGLASKEGKLHPVQQAMYELHGSQCGFCTPGFIMSLFAWYHADVTGNEDDDTIHEMLAGNLCRCTGYRPIIDAARRTGGKKDDWYSRNEAELLSKFEQIRNRQDTLEINNETSYFSPKSLKELCSLYHHYSSAYLFAGGTDLGLLVTKADRKLDVVIHTCDIPELNILTENSDFIEIGASVPYVKALPLIEKYIPEYGKLIRKIGSTQIRNLGTIGGNIGNASPIGDSAPSLIALGASVNLQKQDATRELPLKEFFLGYRKTALQEGEFIRSIKIPIPKKGFQFKVYKVTKRHDQDISSVCGAFFFKIENNKIVYFTTGFGGMAEIPKPAYNLEKTLNGKDVTQDIFLDAKKAVADDFKPISDFRASGDYRATVAANMLERLYTQITKPELVTEVWEL